MATFFIRRFVVTLITVVGSMLILFTLIQLIPGDMATTLLGPRATPQLIERIHESMGLNKPVIVQLGLYFYNILRGDLGVDVLNHMPVSTLVFSALPYTVVLALSSILLAGLLGIPLGTYAASHRNSPLDKIMGIVSISMITTPPFLAGLFALLIFAVQLNWFPTIGGGEAGNFLDQVAHLILPAFSLALGWVGYIARLTRSTLLEELNSDYIRTARAKGLSERVVLYKHALREALIPVVTVVGIGFGNLLGGAVLTEIIFHRPGLGFLIYNAIKSRNFPVLQGGLVIAVLLYSLANLVADLSHGFTDPRIRLE
jgi:peptide/nickel transport system permease protein